MGRALLLMLFASLVTAAFPAGPKLRGLWVDVFHEGIKNPFQIAQLIERAKRANANALFIQVRSRAQVYHFSAFEHRAPDADPVTDCLAEVIKLAHAQNPPIQVHAWLNAHPLWESKTDPPWPDHVVLRHPEWLTKDINGSTSTDVGRALDFGNPEAAEYLLRLYLEVVRNYDVDGIHLDFIRYTGVQFGYNDVSVKRFFESLTPEQKKSVLARSKAIARAKPTSAAGKPGFFPGVDKPATIAAKRGLPATDDPLFSDWRRAQVTGFVRRLVYHAKSLKPKIIVSAATIPWGDAPADFKQSAAYKRVFQDWKGWAEEGLLDLLIPMLYFREDQHADWFRNWVTYCENLHTKTPIAAGIGNWLNSHGNSLRQANYADSHLAGVCFFSYASTNPMEGKEAELFNENFYTKVGELPRAGTIGPNERGIFAKPSTFGYKVSGDLESAVFYLGEPTSRQVVLGATDAASLNLLSEQVNVFENAARRFIPELHPTEFTLGDQLIEKQNSNELWLTDISGKHKAIALLPGFGDNLYLPGEVIALTGKCEDGRILTKRVRWLGVSR